MLGTALAYNGVYGVALSLLILSWYIYPALLEMFVGQEYTLGNHGQMWANWHVAGCLSIGSMNIFALGWEANLFEAKQSVCLVSAFVYGVWIIQNFQLMTVPGKMRPAMWIHVIGCGIGCCLAVMGRFA